MNFTLFVSKKFLISKKESKFISAISLIAMIGIAIGVAVLIIALSVTEGFKVEIENKLVGFYSHIDLSAFEGQYLPPYEKSIQKIYNIDTTQIINVSPYAGQLALLRTKFNRDGVYIKGIAPELDISDLRKNIIQGIYELKPDQENPSLDTSRLNSIGINAKIETTREPSFDTSVSRRTTPARRTWTDEAGGQEPSIIVGKKLATRLGIKLGDKVTAFALKSLAVPISTELPGIMNFRVTGIYESGISEYDDLNVYVNIKSAQELFSFDNMITGYDIKLHNAYLADSIGSILMTRLGYPYYARSVFQIHRNIFTWVELQKKPIPIVLGLIIIVAVFNVISTLLMIVLERTNAVGILKSLGASIKQIKKIFLINGFIIGFVGTIIGNLLALVLLLLQINYEIIRIPEGIYFLNKVPIALSFDSFLVTSLISIILATIASYIPASLAAKSNPITALRFS